MIDRLKAFLNFSKIVSHKLLNKAAKQRKLVCFLKLAVLTSRITSAEVGFLLSLYSKLN